MLAWVGALAAPFLFPYEGIGYAINLGVAGLVLIWMAKMLEGQEAQTALLQKLTAGGGPLPVLRARTVEFDDLKPSGGPEAVVRAAPATAKPAWDGPPPPEAGSAPPRFAASVEPDTAAADPAEMLTPQADGAGDQDIEGQTFAIRYKAADGAITLRRITATRVDGQSLAAYCHERRAPRAFRLDRITDIVTADGEALPPGPFFQAYGIDLKTGAAPAPPPGVSIEALRRQSFNDARAGARLLAALARADGDMASAEMAEAAGFITAYIREMHIAVKSEEATRAAAYVARLYPTPAQIDKAIEKVAAMPQPIQRLWRDHAERLIQADGVLHPAEADLIQRIDAALNLS